MCILKETIWAEYINYFIYSARHEISRDFIIRYYCTFRNSMSQSSSIPPRRHRHGAITRRGDSRYVVATRSRWSDRYPDYARSRADACTRYHNVAETFAARADSAKNRPLTWSPILFPSRCLSHWRPDRDVGRRDVEVGHPAEDRPRRKRENRNARETPASRRGRPVAAPSIVLALLRAPKIIASSSRLRFRTRRSETIVRNLIDQSFWSVNRRIRIFNPYSVKNKWAVADFANLWLLHFTLLLLSVEVSIIVEHCDFYFISYEPFLITNGNQIIIWVYSIIP